MSTHDERGDKARRVALLLIKVIKDYQGVTGASLESLALMISPDDNELRRVKEFAGVPVYRTTRLAPGAVFVTERSLAQFIVSHERAAAARWN